MVTADDESKAQVLAANYSTDFRNASPRAPEAARAANQAPVYLLKRVAERKNATPAQIALAWLLAQKDGAWEFLG